MHCSSSFVVCSLVFFLWSIMTKSKTNSSILCSTQGDFWLQTNRHASASCTPKVQSRSCSLIQHGFISPSPTSTPPRMKAIFADFTDLLSTARVSSKHKNKTMQKNSSPAQSPHPPPSCGCNEDSFGSSRPSLLPTERLVGSNPRGSCPGSGGLNPAPSTVSPSLPSSGKGHPSVFPSGVTPPLLAPPLLHPR